MADMRLIVAGAGWRMGRTFVKTISQTPGAVLTGALEAPGSELLGQDAGVLAGLPANGVKLSSDLWELSKNADGVIDFTVPQATIANVAIAAERRLVHVIGTTGLSASDDAVIKSVTSRAIVVQSGRTIDVSDPERSVIRRPVSNSETRLAERFAAPSTPEEVKLPLRGSIVDAPQPKPRVAPTPAPAPAPAPTPAPAAPAGEVKTAPRVEVVAPAPAARLDNTLGSLAKDIAKSIDTETLSEIWERREAGRALDVSRRLYTLRGQQIFDEVADKYRRDDGFRTAVDRYCDDFERLLDRVSRTEGGKLKVRNYEMSDTGKAYVMLAHASGRLA